MFFVLRFVCFAALVFEPSVCDLTMLQHTAILLSPSDLFEAPKNKTSLEQEIPARKFEQGQKTALRHNIEESWHCVNSTLKKIITDALDAPTESSTNYFSRLTTLIFESMWGTSTVPGYWIIQAGEIETHKWAIEVDDYIWKSENACFYIAENLLVMAVRIPFA